MNELFLNLSKLGTPLYFYEKEKIISNSEKLKSYFKNLSIFYASKGKL